MGGDKTASVLTNVFLTLTLHILLFNPRHQFFQRAGLEAEAASFSTIGTSCVLVLMTLVSVPLMDYAGRRTLMLVGLGCIAVAEVLISIMMTQVKSRVLHL